MSFHAIAWAVRQSLPCPQKIVLVMLADRHNGDTGQCNPSHERLAADCGLSRRSVVDQIGKLEESGYLTVIHRSIEGLKKSNQYRLHTMFGKQVSDVQEVHYDVQEVPVVVQEVHGGSAGGAHKPGIKPIKNHKTRTDAHGIGFSEIKKPKEVSDNVWSDFISHRTEKRARLTSTALADIEREAKKAGWTLEDALAKSVARGWVGFEAEWVTAPAAPAKGKAQPGEQNYVPPVSGVWHESLSGVASKAAELGLAPRDEVMETAPAFKRRVMAEVRKVGTA